jgi:hypothetical protein
MKHGTGSLLLGGLAGLALLGCPGRPAPAGAGANATPSASAATSASGAPPPAAWYVGSWSGTFAARPFRVILEKKPDGLPGWSKDDGKVGSGSGTLSLTIDASRRVVGSAQGALGDLLVTGEIDGDTLRAAASPKAPAALDGFAGTLVARRSADALVGRLQASTGDSQTVREAAVRLERAAPPK